jgi:hypothetical protein
MASAAEGLTDRRWREGLEQLRAKRAAAWDRWARGWAQCLLLCTCLYLFIGASPFPHQQLVDPETGGMVMSPINRYVWILLLLLSLPLLWVRRRALLPALRRLPLLNAVMLWFWMTTFWALDPGTAGRRLFLYTVIVLIDLLCWIVAPTLSMTPLGLAAIHTHKNVLGGVMLFSCLMLSTFALSQKTWAGRFGWGAIFLLALLLLVASQSKTSLFIFIVVVTSAPLVVALGRAEVGVSFALAAMVGGMICVNLLAPMFGASSSPRSRSVPCSDRASAPSGTSTRACSPACSLACGSPSRTPTRTRRTMAISTCWSPPAPWA